jgi:hypothetical protein
LTGGPLRLPALGTEPEYFELGVDYFEVVASTNLLPGLLEEVVFELQGGVATYADNVLVRNGIVLQLVVFVTFREVELSQKSERRQ